mmetsp:Transcript_33132/g.76398  ORF Transcript_33132/g.76398 Transcript_33132/m.76398 type:complete len:651 (-) Transcript_33132:337-2289(-)
MRKYQLSVLLNVLPLNFVLQYNIRTLSGQVLSYICAIMTPMPGQNEWIDGVHTTGILDWKTLLHILIISTLGMISGLSLGPELPLVLMAGMIGSKLGIETKQSVLRARVLNLTCAAAAIGGFFRFPMAGALFILEIPHRFGLQYFEALSPATLASIMAVIVNRFVSGDEVTGYFTYPFLTETLPPHVFFMAILYGVLGSLSGVMYARLCLKLKGDVHHWFHEPHDDHHEDNNNHEESIPLVGTPGLLASSAKKVKRFQCYIKGEPRRAAFAGTIAGFIVGVICMFLPHLLFWGEGQLQTLIDRGHTPLPFFGRDGKPTEDLTAWGYCMDEELRGGNSLACYGIISVGKVVVTGLSLGTGIMGGHFWGPLYTGAAAAWFFHYFFEQFFPFFPALSEFPCVGILCIMGATHVVTYRAHTAIMLVLTLTIKNFLSEDDTGTQAGDFAAIFPLLVVACYVSLILTQNVIFYKEQRERTDIVAVPEVLCEPNKEGNPVFPVHSVEEFSDEDDSTDCESVEEIAPPPVFKPPTKPPRRFHRKSMSMDADFGKMNLGSLEIRQRLDSTGSTGSGSRTTPNKLERINSFGKVSPHHGSLMGQGTERRSHHRVSSYGSNSSGPMRKSLSRSSSIASSQNGSDSVDIFAAATAGLDLSKI